MRTLLILVAAIALTGCNEQDPQLRHKYFTECLKVFEVEAPSMTASKWVSMIDSCQQTAITQSYKMGRTK